MKTSRLRRHLDRLAGIVHRRSAARRDRAETSLYGEMQRGALIGTVLCAGAAGIGAAAIDWQLAAWLGAALGSLIGLLLWLESPGLPADPVLAPAPGLDRRPRRARVGDGTRGE